MKQINDNVKGLEQLSIKQRNFIKFYLKNGNGTESAMKAYNCKNRAVAGVISAQNLEKLRDPLKLLMEERGISIGKLLDILDEGLRANVKDRDGTEIPDHKTRHRYLETASRFWQIEKETSQNPSITSSQFNFFSVSKEEQDNFNEKFVKFLKNQDVTNENFMPETIIKNN